MTRIKETRLKSLELVGADTKKANEIQANKIYMYIKIYLI